VAAFLEGRLNFSGIPAVIEAVMNQAAGSASDLHSVLAADARARVAAQQLIDSGRHGVSDRRA
jgi:1-deoxy-D-xylulose-5-phosphate reductoisomerase